MTTLNRPRLTAIALASAYLFYAVELSHAQALSVPVSSTAAGQAAQKSALGSDSKVKSVSLDPACRVEDAVAPIDPNTHLPAPSNDPLTQVEASRSRIAEVAVSVGGLNKATGMLPADGLSLVPVTVKLYDVCGQLVKGNIPLQVNAGSLRIAPKVDKETSKLVDSIGKGAGVDVLEAVDGVAQFNLVAPTAPIDVPLTIKAGTKEAKGKISFAPDLRPLIASGLVEGIINLGSRGSQSITPSTGLNDNFERELTRFQRQFNGGDISLAGRSAFFVKGEIKGEYLLTAAFDSEKESRSRILQDINPDKYYPVMGDSSVRGIEARSSDRLYVRVDNGKNYVLYGDFATGDGFSQQMGGTGVGNLQQRNLGQYNRTMTGIRVHRQDDQGFLDSFAMRDSLRQAIEEYRANGTSGPFSVGNLNALENSEKIEVIVRDRNNASRILSITPMTRYVDYTFEPFSGQILLKAPLGSLDPNLNPVSLRITYEVDTGGNPFWVYGVAGQRKITERVEVGGSYMKDENPSAPSGGVGYATSPAPVGTTTNSVVAIPKELRELKSANIGIKFDESNKLVLEVAQSTSATPDTDIEGFAERLDYLGRGLYTNPFTGQTGLRYESRIWGGNSDKNFNNPAAAYTGGRAEFGLKTAAEITLDTKILVEGIYSEDKIAETQRNAESVRVEKKLDERWTIHAGARHVYQSAGAVESLSSSASSINLPGQGSIFGTSGLNPTGAGFWGTGAAVNTVTGQPQSMLNGQVLSAGVASPELEAWTIRAGANYAVQQNWKVGLEVGQDIGINNDPYWMAVSTDYVYKDGRVFGRYETPTGRATAGGDYKVTQSISLYGRYENTNGLASSYALDSAAKSEALIFGVRQSDGKGLENFSEMRMQDSMNGQALENATGLRNTFPIVPGLKGNLSAERLKIFSGQSRGATALGGGLEWVDDEWRGSTRLEWRQLDPTSGSVVDDTTESWMNTISLAKKLDLDWTALIRNYLLVTDNHSIAGNQIQNRFQIGAAYRPVHDNAFDFLGRYENKYERNQEIDPREQRFVHILSTNVNYHPIRDWWTMGRFATKYVNENLAGVHDSYLAWLTSARIIYDLNKDWDVGVMGSVMGSPQGGTNQYAHGAEVGYLIDKNIWASVGYNFSGFSDRDLTGSDYTRKGVYVRLRMKFDETGLKNTGNAIKARFIEE
jgi:hypothetical protein